MTDNVQDAAAETLGQAPKVGGAGRGQPAQVGYLFPGFRQGRNEVEHPQADPAPCAG